MTTELNRTIVVGEKILQGSADFRRPGSKCRAQNKAEEFTGAQFCSLSGAGGWRAAFSRVSQFCKDHRLSLQSLVSSQPRAMFSLGTWPDLC